MSDYSELANIGSDEQVSINQMISLIEDISQVGKLKNYQLAKPKGVRADLAIMIGKKSFELEL